MILWQIDIIGVRNNPEVHNNEKGAKLLVDYLSQYYSLEHQVVLYEAAQYPGFEPRIEKLMLKHLHAARFSSISTLYIPPASTASYDETLLDALHISK